MAGGKHIIFAAAAGAMIAASSPFGMLDVSPAVITPRVKSRTKRMPHFSHKLAKGKYRGSKLAKRRTRNGGNHAAGY